jgi:hypothetical protein
MTTIIIPDDGDQASQLRKCIYLITNEMKARTAQINEIRAWQNLLRTLRTENIKLKDRLADAIRADVKVEFVEEAEEFQQRFIENDQVIDLLRREMGDYLLLISDQGKPLTEIQLQALKKDTIQLEKEFDRVRNAFDVFLEQ